MKNTKETLLWITTLLENKKIKYRITGGFAAQLYGAQRPLADIDIDVANKDIALLKEVVQPYIIFGPDRYIDNEWDVILMTLRFEGQEIDIVGNSGLIFNKSDKEWEKFDNDLENATLISVFGKIVPVEPKESLILYKSKLQRDVDLEDIRQLTTDNTMSKKVPTMKIAIGSANKGKIEAVRRACHEYPVLANAELVNFDVPSGVSSQPIGLDETVSGAKNRAKKAFEMSGADLGVGLESGIFLVPHTKSEYMDTTACAIFDGKTFHIGLSSCFEYPKKMIEGMLAQKKEVTDMAIEMGFAKERSFREGQGMVGVLTKERVNRIDYSYQAVQMALIHLENPEHY